VTEIYDARNITFFRVPGDRNARVHVDFIFLIEFRFFVTEKKKYAIYYVYINYVFETFRGAVVPDYRRTRRY